MCLFYLYKASQLFSQKMQIMPTKVGFQLWMEKIWGTLAKDFWLSSRIMQIQVADGIFWNGKVWSMIYIIQTLQFKLKNSYCCCYWKPDNYKDDGLIKHSVLLLANWLLFILGICSYSVSVSNAKNCKDLKTCLKTWCYFII